MRCDAIISVLLDELIELARIAMLTNIIQVITEFSVGAKSHTRDFHSTVSL